MRRLANLIALPGLAVALAAGAIVLSVVGLPDDPPPADADLIVEPSVGRDFIDEGGPEKRERGTFAIEF